MDDDAFWAIQLRGGHAQSEEVESLFDSTEHGTTWLAPQEREGLNFVTRNNSNNEKDNDENEEYEENNIRYEWIDIPLPPSQSEKIHDIIPSFSQQGLSIRSIKSSLSLMESHVGEEVWDAAKLFCIYLCTKLSNCDDRFDIDNNHITSSLQRNEKKISDDDDIDIHIKGKRILELGAGCGLLGMCCSTLGAKEVLCTDYLPEVMNNLAYNLKYNMDIVMKNRRNANHSCKGWIKCGVLDWKDFIAPDLKEVDWIMDDGGAAAADVIKICQDNVTTTNGKDSDNENETQDNVFFAKQASTFEADILIGSALIYSVQGAMYCADTIHYFFETNQTKTVYILQMTGRPGFHRFLMRLNHWAIKYQTFEVSEDVYNNANVSTPREEFKLFKITPN